MDQDNKKEMRSETGIGARVGRFFRREVQDPLVSSRRLSEDEIAKEISKIIDEESLRSVNKPLTTKQHLALGGMAAAAAVSAPFVMPDAEINSQDIDISVPGGDLGKGDEGLSGVEQVESQVNEVSALPSADNVTQAEIDALIETGVPGSNPVLTELATMISAAAITAEQNSGPRSASAFVAYEPNGDGTYSAIPYLLINQDGVNLGTELDAGSIVFMRAAAGGGYEYAYLEPVNTPSEGQAAPTLARMTDQLRTSLDGLVATPEIPGDLSAEELAQNRINVPAVGSWVAMNAVPNPDGSLKAITLVGLEDGVPTAWEIQFIDPLDEQGNVKEPAPTPRPALSEFGLGNETASGSRLIAPENLVSITEELSVLPGRENGPVIEYTSGVEVMIDGKELTIVTNIPGLEIRDVNVAYMKALMEMGNVTFQDGDVVRILYNPDGTYDGINVIDPLMESTKPGDYGTVMARVQYSGGSQVFTAHISEQALQDFNVIYPVNCADVDLDPSFCVDRDGNPVEVVDFDVLSATFTSMVLEAMMQDGWLNRMNGMTNQARTDISPWVFTYAMEVNYSR